MDLYLSFVRLRSRIEAKNTVLKNVTLSSATLPTNIQKNISSNKVTYLMSHNQ